MEDAGNWVKVAKVDDVGPGQGFDTGMEVAGDVVGVFNIDGELFAVGECTHERGPISQGAIEGHEVLCPWHSAKFNVKTGKCLQGAVACRVDGQIELDAGHEVELAKPLYCYDVKVEGDDILVRPRQ